MINTLNPTLVVNRETEFQANVSFGSFGTFQGGIVFGFRTNYLGTGVRGTLSPLYCPLIERNFYEMSYAWANRAFVFRTVAGGRDNWTRMRFGDLDWIYRSRMDLVRYDGGGVWDQWSYENMNAEYTSFLPPYDGRLVRLHMQ